MDNPGYEELIEKTEKFERFYNEEYPHSALEYKSLKEVFEENLSLHKIAWFFVQFFGVHYKYSEKYNKFEYILIKYLKEIT